MNPRHHLWFVCALVLAAFTLASPPPATAQADRRDPLEASQESLDIDLDNLPPEDDDPDLRLLIGNVVIRDLIPELARLAGSPDPGVQIAVARSMGVIVLELKESLTPRANDLVRETILRIQKARDPGPRRAVIDTTG